MKIRHVRAVAVAAVALVALTGARSSGGGGCDDSGGGSSSSSGSSGGDSGSDVGKSDDDTGQGADTTTGGSTTTDGSSTTTGGSGSNAAAKDLRIEACAWNGSELTARVRATNRSNNATYTYKYKLTFSGHDGKTLDTSNPVIPYVLPGQAEVHDTATPYDAPGDARLGAVTCKVSEVERTEV